MAIQPARRLWLAGCCLLAAASAAPAQTLRWAPGQPQPSAAVAADESAHPSHKLLPDLPIGDLNGAEDALARRLKKSQNLDELKDLVKKGLEDPETRRLLKEKLKAQLKSDRPEDADKGLDDLLDMVKDNPQLLDDPHLRGLLDEQKMQDLLNDAKGKGLQELPEDKKQELAGLAKDFLDKIKPPDPGRPTDPAPGDPPASSRPAGPAPAAPAPVTAPRVKTQPAAPPADSKPSWVSREMIDGVAGMIKDIDKSSEGESLRTALREIAKMDTGGSGASDGSGFFKGLFSPEDAGWLARNLKLPSGPNFGDWSPPAAAPSLGAGSADGVQAMLPWVALLALFALAGWMVWTLARRQAQAARARARAWSPGPWPVQPSQVSTREDLVRAFEHLAYLLLGRGARALNHIDVAARLREKDHGRHGAAARLGRLYEQARYAPPQEPLAADELAAARGDLAALAGAAA